MYFPFKCHKIASRASVDKKQTVHYGGARVAVVPNHFNFKKYFYEVAVFLLVKLTDSRLRTLSTGGGGGALGKGSGGGGSCERLTE